MCARNGMIMLMNHEMVPVRRFIALVKVDPVGMSQSGGPDCRPSRSSKFRTEESDMIINF